MKRRIQSIATATAALLLVSSGTVSAAWQCGYDIPDCVTVNLEKREVWMEFRCAHPVAIGVTVENGLGSGISKSPDGLGHIYLSAPIDTDSNNPAYYADTSCCEDSAGDYSCQPDQLPKGVVKGE